MRRKYLEDIGYYSDLDNLDPESHNSKWEKQRQTYGFDVRDTWNLDKTMLALLYERLQMYNQVNNIDTECHSIEFGGEKLTMQQVLDKMLANGEKVLTEEDYFVDFAQVDDAEKEFWQLWAISHKLFWW